MMGQYTPMLNQYLRIKNEHPNCILFFRLGDFYEMFFDDAKRAASILSIALTSRDGGQGRRVPMCGVPYHAAEGYINKLIRAGQKVAICEQVEDAKLAKGLVRREVVNIITPGTVVDGELLDPVKNNYLLALVTNQDNWGFSYIDVSTGEFSSGQLRSSSTYAEVMDKIAQVSPQEMVVSPSVLDEHELMGYLKQMHIIVNEGPRVGYQQADDMLCKQLDVASLAGFGLFEKPYAVEASGLLLQYLHSTHKSVLQQVTTLQVTHADTHMMVDYITRRNLELTETFRSGDTQGSLLWLLQQTVTAMGGRLLSKWVQRPLKDQGEIEHRLEVVQELYDSPILLAGCRKILSNIYDCERILSKAAAGRAHAKDLLSLKSSLQNLPKLQGLLSDGAPLLQQCLQAFEGLEEVAKLLQKAIQDDPATGFNEGNLIKDGYSLQIDTLRANTAKGQQWLAELEAKEKEMTGIKSLKVGYNKVFGYYIEVTRSNLDAVPKNYIRKQTLANAERYITEELKVQEERILMAEEQLKEKEFNLFREIREQVITFTPLIQQASQAVAIIDVLCSFALVAKRHNYVRPHMNTSGELVIKGGRHPVVERVRQDAHFVPNDTFLSRDHFVNIITGPNMAGKSTYIRQIAVIVLLAQMGSFVPAEKAKIGIVDRLFTRVGAADDLFAGQSTFMVEMTEVANICNNATEHSLVILDEIGRGTSTYDGMSIAKSVIEYIYTRIKCKTLFATHYHELTQLATEMPGLINLSVAVHDDGKNVAFLYKIVEGPMNRSYGIHVAKMAGVPYEVVARANQYLADLQSQNSIRLNHKHYPPETTVVKEEAVTHPFLLELAELDPNTLSPLQALQQIYKWKRIIDKTKGGEA